MAQAKNERSTEIVVQESCVKKVLLKILKIPVLEELCNRAADLKDLSGKANLCACKGRGTFKTRGTFTILKTLNRKGKFRYILGKMGKITLSKQFSYSKIVYLENFECFARGHSFSAYAIFSEKVTFLTP